MGFDTIGINLVGPFSFPSGPILGPFFPPLIFSPSALRAFRQFLWPLREGTQDSLCYMGSEAMQVPKSTFLNMILS